MVGSGCDSGAVLAAYNGKFVVFELEPLVLSMNPLGEAYNLNVSSSVIMVAVALI